MENYGATFSKPAVTSKWTNKKQIKIAFINYLDQIFKCSQVFSAKLLVINNIFAVYRNS